MPEKLTHLLERMTPQEQAEVETFAAFVLARRLQTPHLLHNDIATQELTELVMDAGGFDWLGAAEEDIYALEDGTEVQWPNAA